jgi:hypothetical protein
MADVDQVDRHDRLAGDRDGVQEGRGRITGAAGGTPASVSARSTTAAG